jgi:hypothetical protein
MGDSLFMANVEPSLCFSYFKPPIAKKRGEPDIPFSTMTLQDLYEETISCTHEYITDQLRCIVDKSEKSKYKATYFAYITPNGTCSRRDQKYFTGASGYFVVDFDALGDKRGAVKQRLVNDVTLPIVFICTSPSYEGLKVLLRIDPQIIDYDAKSNKMHKPFFAFNRYLAEKYADIITPDEKGNFIDPSGKDILRACFVCFDPDAYFNPNVENVIDNDFVEKYYQGSENKKKSQFKSVSPRTTIDILAKRHLTDDNHHPQLRDFISACKAIGYDKQTVQTYIEHRVQISAESAHADRNKLIKEIEDLYNRYPVSCDIAIFLTPLCFAYDIFLFKWSKEADDFILSGLYYDGIRQFLHSCGFWKRYDNNKNSILIKETGKIIKEVSSETLRDCLMQYVEKIIDPTIFSYQGKTYTIPPDAAREFFLKNSNNIFNDHWLEHLQEHNIPILKDTNAEIFLVFEDSIVIITGGSINETPTSELKGFCIWEHQQIKRRFTYPKTKSKHSQFLEFLNNITAGDIENLSAIESILGYLMHNYTRLSEGQAVILYDQSITDIKNPMGGTGKGLIAHALRQVRNVTKVDGKHLDGTSRFKFERVTLSTQIVWLDDVKKDFEFSMLHSNLTDGWTIERKHLPQIFIDAKNSPKALICSNVIIKGGGTTNKRRQIVFELGDYYSSRIKTGLEKPIEELHGGVFFDDWPDEEWCRFFALMCDCAKLYLSQGLMKQKGGNVELNRFRQATSDDFDKWCHDQSFTLETEYNTKILHEDFVAAYYGEHYKIKFSQRTFTSWLKQYAEFKRWLFYSRKTNGNILFHFACQQ